MDHVSALRSVEHLSLGDSDYTEAEILSVLRRPEHMAIGAWKDAILVGFCSCLVTATAAGLRLELDMLGVLQKYRNHGIASELVGACLAWARDRGIDRARALVRKDNLPSLKVFRHHGIAARQLLALWIHELAPPASGSGGASAKWNVHFQRLSTASRTEPATAPAYRCRVASYGGALMATADLTVAHTLAYKGIWVEKLWYASHAALIALLDGLRIFGHTQNLDEIGRLGPVDRRDDWSWIAENMGWAPVGCYWWLES